MYKSPIDILVADIQHQIAEQQDEQIYKAVVSVGINVDKEELIRALAYDRHQYMKGHMDGVAEATPKWVPVTERLPENDMERVLVSSDCDTPVGNQKMDTDRYRGGKWVRYGDHVTHWMPLPKPPKEEE